MKTVAVEEEEVAVEEEGVVPRRSQREPVWMKDYEGGDQAMRNRRFGDGVYIF